MLLRRGSNVQREYTSQYLQKYEGLIISILFIYLILTSVLTIYALIISAHIIYVLIICVLIDSVFNISVILFWIVI